LARGAHSLAKAERLSGRKYIKQLFDRHRAHPSCKNYPLVVVWMPLPVSETGPPARAVFTVPKRQWKKAVVRNRIKRRMREAYRLEKPMLYACLQERPSPLAVLLLYIGRNEPEVHTLRKSVRKSFQRICQWQSGQAPWQ
jgi:ribonuclease P protein component